MSERDETTKSEEYWRKYRSMVKAEFAPKKMEDLKPELASYVGSTFTFECMGQSDEDEPYPGQFRWHFAGDAPDDIRGLWCPEEDIKVIEVLDRP